MGGGDSTIIKCAISVVCLSTHVFILVCNHWDDWDTFGMIKFGMQSWDLKGIV